MAHCIQSCSVSQAQLEGLSLNAPRWSYDGVMRASTQQLNALYYAYIDSAALTKVP